MAIKYEKVTLAFTGDQIQMINRQHQSVAPTEGQGSAVAAKLRKAGFCTPTACPAMNYGRCSSVAFVTKWGNVLQSEDKAVPPDCVISRTGTKIQIRQELIKPVRLFS